MTLINRSFEILQSNHPYFNVGYHTYIKSGEVKDIMDKSWEKYKIAKQNGVNGDELNKLAGYNTCCLQLSHALNQSEMQIENFSNFFNEEIKGNKVRAYSDDKNNFYILSPIDMRAYLKQKYFPPENYNRSPEQMKGNIKNRKGIVVFGNSHVDLWNGKQFHQKQVFGGWDPFKHSFDHGGNGIFFWEMMNTWMDLFDWSTNSKALHNYFDKDYKQQ